MCEGVTEVFSDSLSPVERLPLVRVWPEYELVPHIVARVRIATIAAYRISRITDHSFTLLCGAGRGAESSKANMWQRTLRASRCSSIDEVKRRVGGDGDGDGDGGGVGDGGGNGGGYGNVARCCDECLRGKGAPARRLVSAKGVGSREAAHMYASGHDQRAEARGRRLVGGNGGSAGSLWRPTCLVATLVCVCACVCIRKCERVRACLRARE